MTLRLVVDNTRGRPISVREFVIDRALARRGQAAHNVVVWLSWAALLYGAASTLALVLS